ncbi:MFS transporter [Rivibacter subsaxonicus]|uniref:PAT family beta-lactamase induction signal transducer AmpG n=1 Tax=Rivibacter subsaxonicus TaxID=457575 RepID=A0A4Q7V8S3_9BURK|nr:MFS transporter [Rivibacter subsaxonicus]RZT91900.1 PAT family beta-lactamase induction signal transducer AmpG [Rivibacter subsaxonicus]
MTTADHTAPAVTVKKRSPISWVPTLYFAQGLQFFVVMLIAGLMFKSMGVANDLIARWTGVLGLAWAFKPLWSPFLEMARSKKLIVVALQFTGAIGLALLALAVQLPMFFAASIAVLFLLAYASATHDIACDGLYMAALDARSQAAYAGWQGAFFNASKFLTLGGLLVLAGHLEKSVGVHNAWSAIFVLLAVLLAAIAAYNAWALPGTLNTGHADLTLASVTRTLRDVVGDFLSKPGIGLAILFIVLFRAAEGQVQTIGPLFMLEARDQGGLGLTTDQIGIVYGTAGTLAFLLGSILGGYFTSWLGLKRAMFFLILGMMVPNLVFAWLAHARPSDLNVIGTAVSIEMFGYGFGFVGMILYIMQAVAPGRFQTAHYALGTGVMQLGFILSKTISGDIQLALGYERFFLWTVLCGLPVLALMFFVRIPGRSDATSTAPDAAVDAVGNKPAGA